MKGEHEVNGYEENFTCKDLHLLKKGANLLIKYNDEIISIPKIINGHRIINHKTKSELKELKLEPTAPPVGYGLQQFNGDIFYIYDIEKTRLKTTTDKERQANREYKEKLKIRKTCPRCGIIQKYLEDIRIRESLFNIDKKRIECCDNCYNELQEIELDKQRNVKHDFTSYFIDNGINLNNILENNEMYETVYIDFETTGLSYQDEILQVAIIDDKERVLLYKLCSPIGIKKWDEAMNINGITPKDVEGFPHFEEYVNEISDILTRSKKIVIYNVQFEKMFFEKYDIKYNENLEDCMILFAEIYGDWNEYYGNYKWQSLSTAANCYGYKFKNKHNSLSDCFATKFVYEEILKRKNN